MKKKLFITSILIFIIALVVYFLKKETVVESFTIKEKEIIEAIYSTGTVTSEKKALIKSNVMGTIRRVEFREGETVSKGQSILKINSEKQSLQIKETQTILLQSEANVKEAQSNLNLILNGSRKEDILASKENINQIKTDLDKAKMDLKRKEVLFKENAVTKSEVDNARQTVLSFEARIRSAGNQTDILEKGNRPEQIEIAKARLESAQGKYEQSKVALLRATKDLNDYEIFAPFSGIITNYNIQEGDSINIGSNLLTILDPKYFKIKTEIDEVDILRVKRNQSVLVSLDADPDRILKAKVTRIVPQTDTVSKTCQVIVTLDNFSNSLIEGMTASVNIVTKKRKGFTIPVSGIVRDGEKSFVWKINSEKKLEKIDIVTGVQDGSNIELKNSSLKKGELIVSTVKKELKEGKSVKIKDI